jgi:glycosyltransferase involved in cell wall biosynthesis
MRVAALTGGQHVPSARFRVRQYIGPLSERDIDVKEYVPAISRYAKLPGALGRVKPRYLGPIGALWAASHYVNRLPGVIRSYSADIVWLSRELVRWGVSFEPLLKRPLVFDVDDAIWLKRPFVAKIARSATAVFAGNQFLADWFSQHNPNVFIIPTAIDTDRFRPRDHRPDDQPFTIGWTGSSPNLRYLEGIQAPLAQFLRTHKDARLLIVCDQSPQLPDLPPSRIEFVRWTPVNEAASVARMDVGLMPLHDSDWERGKCSFKMLQYMACGLPVIVSPVGMNAELLAQAEIGIGTMTLADWLDALEWLADNPGQRTVNGMQGRALVQEAYSVSAIAEQIGLTFRQLHAGMDTAR